LIAWSTRIFGAISIEQVSDKARADKISGDWRQQIETLRLKVKSEERRARVFRECVRIHTIKCQ
jgi:hypothetical protein